MLPYLFRYKLGTIANSQYDAILKICEKYNINVIDCHKYSALNTSDSEIRKTYTFATSKCPNGDGIHPDLEGLRNYMPVILSEFK